MPRRPDRRFRDCLLTEQPQSSDTNEHTITWDTPGLPADPGLPAVAPQHADANRVAPHPRRKASGQLGATAPRSPADPVDGDDDVDLQLALYESMLQQTNGTISREEEKCRVENAKLKYGFVHSRLRLFKSEPVVDILLRCIEWECTSRFEQNGTQPVVRNKNEIINWITNQSPALHILLELDLLRS